MKYQRNINVWVVIYVRMGKNACNHLFESWSKSKADVEEIT